MQDLELMIVGLLLCAATRDRYEKSLETLYNLGLNRAWSSTYADWLSATSKAAWRWLPAEEATQYFGAKYSPN